MKQTATHIALPGQTLAKSVVNKDGMVILSAGTELTEQYIRRLKKLGISDIFVRREEAAPPASGRSPEPYPQPFARRQSMEASGMAVKKTMNDLKENQSVQKRLSVPSLGYRFSGLYRKLLDEAAGHPYIMSQLVRLHQKDPFLFEHTMHVSVFATIVGFANRYSEQQLYDLFVSSLLFDIGMLNVPDRLYRKAGRLTAAERERIEYHTIDGHQMLAARSDLPRAAAACALQHHERFDGSGYPFRIRKNELHEFPQIIGIADLYDALVSKRHYRNPFTPGDAIEFLLGSGDRLFDLSFVQLFVRHVSIYPLGSRVLLNSGQIAVIEAVDPSFVQRPVVKVIQEPDGKPAKYPYEIDLKSRLEVVIADVLP